MKTQREAETSNDCTAQQARHASIRAAAADSTLPLRQALAHVAELERTLASSREECFVARQRIDFLALANARLRGAVIQRGPLPARGRGSSEPPATFRNACLTSSLEADAMGQLERLMAKRLRLHKGASIYDAGSAFRALHLVCTGSCKTVLLTKDGQAQVAGYHLAGDVIGLDGIGTGSHECQAIALEDVELCPLPFDEVERLAHSSAAFGHNLHVLLSLEGGRTRGQTTLLGTMRAEQRVAVFLLDMSRRYAERGYSAREFVLRLTRAEIGSYLGLKLETVSRLFSRFQVAGLIKVAGRTLTLLDLAALAELLDAQT